MLWQTRNCCCHFHCQLARPESVGFWSLRRETLRKSSFAVTLSRSPCVTSHPLKKLDEAVVLSSFLRPSTDPMFSLRTNSFSATAKCQTFQPPSNPETFLTRQRDGQKWVSEWPVVISVCLFHWTRLRNIWGELETCGSIDDDFEKRSEASDWDGKGDVLLQGPF